MKTSVRRLLVALPVGLALVLGGAGTASADIADDLLFGADSEFCAGVQAVTAEMDADQIDAAGGITNVVYTDETEFVQSKSISDPLTTRQYVVEGPDGDTIYCKGRSVDGLVYDLGEGAAGEETACSAVLERQRDHFWDALTPAEQAAAPYQLDDVEILPDVTEVVGPLWAVFDPPFPTITIDEGTVNLQSRALYATINDPSGLPITFKGNKYCTLPTNENLRTTLGWTKTPAPSPTPTVDPSSEPTAPATQPANEPQDVDDNGAGAPAKPSDDGQQAQGPVLAATGGPSDSLLPTAVLLLATGGLVLVATRRRQARMTDG